MTTKILLSTLLIGLMAFKTYAQDGREVRKIIDTLTYETQSGLPIAASKIYFTDSKFTISGYGESNFINYLGPKNTQSEDLELYMSNMQRFVAYAAYRPKKWLVLYAEIFAEYISDGGSERLFEFMPEVFADFLISPQFNLRLGTHQATLGYLNNSDEPIMFYTVNRPEVERIIIPSTWIDLGIMTYGNITEHLKWSASLYQGLDPTDLNSATWIRRGRAEALRFNFNGYTINPGLKYTGIKGTELALNGIFARMSQDDISSNTHLVSSYLRHNRGNWSFMALGTMGGTDNTQGIFRLTQSYSSNDFGQVLGKRVYGYYTEVGYDILPLLGVKRQLNADKKSYFIKRNEVKLPLFIRYERLDTHSKIDPMLAGYPVFQSDLTAITIGANFNPRRNVVFKTNYQIRNNKQPLSDGTTEGDRFEFGLGFIF